jgi:hypothetical protein
MLASCTTKQTASKNKKNATSPILKSPETSLLSAHSDWQAQCAKQVYTISKEKG